MSVLIDILNQPAEIAAQNILGSVLIRKFGNREVVCRIVETEAYNDRDEASHSFRGNTKRTEVMFGDPGFAYVYFTYGMHYCLNVVCQPKGYGAALLIRAIEPISGTDIIKKNRPNINKETELVNGPGKLTKALLIDKTFYGHNLTNSPLILQYQKAQDEIVSSKRIGISKNKDVLWRYYLKNNPYVSISK